jgi:transposase
MPKTLVINLTSEQKEELEQGRDHHPKPYIRERAAAILKIATGQSGLQVAVNGLLKKRDPDTLYGWVNRYQDQGFQGLFIKPGRGRKPAFFEQYPDKGEAKLAILHIVRRDPALFGHQRTRWSLAMIAQTCPGLNLTTPGGLSQLLARLEISYKRGRDYLHSPDPFYWDKLSLIELCRLRAYYEPARYAFLYLDELTCYRQPSLARAYEAVGHCQPLAQRSYQAETTFRLVGSLNAITGQTLYRQRSKISPSCLAGFYADIRAVHPSQEEIYVVVDNWPIHFHPDVLARLQPQHFPWSPKLPPFWSNQPSKKAIYDNLPIQLLCLPTYASWLNPIEKLWRWLKQDVLHLHRLSDNWQQLKQRVGDFLDQFKDGSTELLTYVGLLPN